MILASYKNLAASNKSRFPLQRQSNSRKYKNKFYEDISQPYCAIIFFIANQGWLDIIPIRFITLKEIALIC